MIYNNVIQRYYTLVVTPAQMVAILKEKGILSSSVGSLTNPSKLANTFSTEKREKLSDKTIKNYLDYLCDSFLVEKAQRYDVKGKKYIDTPSKYYFVDTGEKLLKEKTYGKENFSVLNTVIIKIDN